MYICYDVVSHVCSQICHNIVCIIYRHCMKLDRISQCFSWTIARFVKYAEVTQRRSVAKSVGYLQRRLTVCLFVNTIASERVNIGWWNLGGRCIVQKSRPSSNLRVIALPWVHIPQKCGVGLQRWENQHRLSSFTTRLSGWPASRSVARQNVYIGGRIWSIPGLLIPKRFSRALDRYSAH